MMVELCILLRRLPSAIDSLLLIVLIMSCTVLGAQSSQILSPSSTHSEKAQTPLIAAVALGKAEEVRSLLARGASPNDLAADGRSPLIIAVENDRPEVVRMLILAGADLNFSTQTTGTPLEVAERRDFIEIAAILHQAGARSSGKSPGDTVCVLPWQGDGFCGVVKSFTVRSVALNVTKIFGCAKGCEAREACSALRPVGGNDGIQVGEQIAVPSWCLTKTRVKL